MFYRFERRSKNERERDFRVPKVEEDSLCRSPSGLPDAQNITSGDPLSTHFPWLRSQHGFMRQRRIFQHFFIYFPTPLCIGRHSFSCSVHKESMQRTTGQVEDTSPKNSDVTLMSVGQRLIVLYRPIQIKDKGWAETRGASRLDHFPTSERVIILTWENSLKPINKWIQISLKLLYL